MSKLIRYTYAIIFLFILLVLFLPNDSVYLSFRQAPVIPNIILGIISCIVIFILVKLNKKIDDKKYKTIIIILSIITFILQIVIIKYTFFYTDWDVKTIRDIITNNNIKENYYLTKYPNTLLYLAIIKGYRLIPIIGKHYFPLLVFNASLVNISGLIASLTIKRFTDNYHAIIGYILLMVITLLSPWINIPYSDTFVISIPILIIYLYTKDNKKNSDYFLIGFLSILGYYIKPTALIVLVGIIIIIILEYIKKNNILNKKNILSFCIGVLLSYLVCNISIDLTGFKPCKTTSPFGMIHYLAMGQNNESYGQFNEKDVEESDRYGKRNDIKKTINNIKKRKVIGQFKFIKIKTLLNYNDGTFSWGMEGDKFYYKILAKDSKISTIFKNYFYKDHKYNYLFKLITQFIWILVLILTLFAVKCKNERNMIIYLSLIGITIFLLIFECRARYLYCYSPIFVTASMVGLNKIAKLKKVKK